MSEKKVVTGNKAERTMLADVLASYGPLDKKTVEETLARATKYLQSGYRGNLSNVPRSVERAPHMDDRYYAELLCGRVLDVLGRHGFDMDRVLDALALESTAA